MPKFKTFDDFWAWQLLWPGRLSLMLTWVDRMFMKPEVEHWGNGDLTLAVGLFWFHFQVDVRTN